MRENRSCLARLTIRDEATLQELFDTYLEHHAKPFKRTWTDGYGSDPAELAVASVSDGQFVFRGFLKDGLKNIGFTKEDMLNKMRELKIIAE